MFAFLGLPGGTEWIIILLIALLLFGKRLPEVMRSLAQSIVGFKEEMRKAHDEIDLEGDEKERDRKQLQAKAAAPKEGREKIASDDGTGETSDPDGPGGDGPDGSP